MIIMMMMKKKKKKYLSPECISVICGTNMFIAASANSGRRFQNGETTDQLSGHGEWGNIWSK